MLEREREQAGERMGVGAKGGVGAWCRATGMAIKEEEMRGEGEMEAESGRC